MLSEVVQKMIAERAIDTHVHVGDANHEDGGLRRAWTIQELSDLQIGCIAKAHFLPFTKETSKVHGSLTLNNGLNPDHIYRVSREMSRSWVVWGPTLNAAAHLNLTRHDEAWQKLFRGIHLGSPVSFIDETSCLTTAAKEVVAAIKETGAILATGHISLDEVKALVSYAIEQGVGKIILTHVSSRHNTIPTEEQQRLIDLGKQRGCIVLAEHCAITWIDGKQGAYDLRQDFILPILEIGPENCIISSDAGRIVPAGTGKPTTPQECLNLFCMLLQEGGVSVEALETMLVTGPRMVLGG